MISARLFTGTRSPCERKPTVDVVLEAAARARALLPRSTLSSPSTAPGSTIVAPARFRSSTARHEHLSRSPDRSSRARRPAAARRCGALESVALQRRAVVGQRRVAARADACRWRVGPVTGSSGSSPAITWNTATASATVRAIGPAMSASRFSGTTPAAARQPHRRADAGERLVRRRSADRVAGVAAEADRAEVRRHRRRRAAARPGGDAIERVRILRVAGQDRADGLVRRERPLRHVRLGEHDRAGVLDPLDLKRVPARRRSLRAPAIPSALCSPIVSKLSLTIVGMQCSGPAVCPCASIAIELVGLARAPWD